MIWGAQRITWLLSVFWYVHHILIHIVIILFCKCKRHACKRYTRNYNLWEIPRWRHYSSNQKCVREASIVIVKLIYISFTSCGYFVNPGQCKVSIVICVNPTKKKSYFRARNNHKIFLQDVKHHALLHVCNMHKKHSERSFIITLKLVYGFA